MEAKEPVIVLRYPLILGSASPRRKELLELTGVPFQVVGSEADESFNPASTPTEIVMEITSSKLAFFRDYTDHTVLCADTVVVVDDRVLGKPADEQEAIGMLECISDRTHEVLTGVEIRSREADRKFVVSTEVTFKPLDDSEIRKYVQSGDPMDKAGGYGIQDWIGLIGVTGIKGDYNNVVGLPVQRVFQELKQFFT